MQQSNFQQQQQTSAPQIQPPINYGGQINPQLFHPSQSHNQSTNQNNRNENQTNLHNHGQMRNNSVGHQQNNEINSNFKFPPATSNQNVNGTSNIRPASRGPVIVGGGDQASQRAQNSMSQNQAYAIQNDQQTFQLPPGSMPGAQPFQFTGGPNAASMSNGFQQQQPQNNNMQPQFHFIANQQKFYAQISPDKAPLLFRYNSEKRPFTTAANINNGNMTGNGSDTNKMMMNGIIAASSNVANNNGHQERANSKHGSQSKTGRINNANHGSTKSAQQNQLNPMPYLQMASKTHTGAFPLQQMQMAASQGVKYVSSTGQLAENNNNIHNNHLVSIFGNQQQTSGNNNQQTSQTLQNILNSQNSNHIKVSKIKPNKNNIKEKEQLYEDAIKLKIQSNSYREENLKLKTKIKILENEMYKKERAMEDFIAKMSMNQAIGGVPSNNGGVSAHQTGTMFYQPVPSNSKHQMPANINGVTSNPIPQPQNLTANNNLLLPLSNNFIGGQTASSTQKFQSDTFLVMSLKKQLKDQKQETLKRDEELDMLKKNIKTTQKVEVDIELKTYQDELTRMRFLMEELMREGPNHPIYQKQAIDKIRMLESQIQQQDFMMNQMRQDNTNLANLLRQREEETNKKKEEKEKKVEIKSELTKVKKTLRDKEKEIVKLKQDINNLRRQVSVNGQQASEHSSNITGSNNISTNKTTEKDTTAISQTSNNTQNASKDTTELKTLQKKYRDVLADMKTKKDKIDEQDQVIKKLQERLQGKIDELTADQKKMKQLQDEIEGFKKDKQSKEVAEKKVREIQINYKKELEYMVTKARHEGVKYEQLMKEVRKHMLVKLLDQTKDLSHDQLLNLIKPYSLLTTLQYKLYQQFLQEKFPTIKTALAEACDLELHEEGDDFIKFSEFEDALESIDVKLEADLLDYLKVQFYTQVTRKGFEGEIGFLFKKLFAELENQNNLGGDNLNNLSSQVQRIQSASSSKRARPQTAKSNKSLQQVQQKSSNDLKQIEEEEVDDKEENDNNIDDYQDDFEDQVPGSTKHKSIKSKKSKPQSAVTEPVLKQAEKKQLPEKIVNQKEDDKEPVKPVIKKQQSLKKHDDHTQPLQTDLDHMKDDLLASQKKKKKTSRSIDGGSPTEKGFSEVKSELDGERKETNGDLPEETSEIKRFMDEEEMLDIAEHCFIRVAEMLLEKSKTARSVFTKYSVPEQFPDGTILELMSPIAFLEGVKEAGMDELSEMEAACLLRVLAKPELDNAIILNEFIMIMENFGVMDAFEDDDDDDDYIRSEDDTIITDTGSRSQLKDEEDNKQEADDDNKDKNEEDKSPSKAVGKDAQKPKKKKKIQINFDLLEEKGLKILRKLARFLLERYLHPREFFGPAIYKQLVKTKKRENNVDILQTKDFYLRLKIAGVRKTVKEIDNLNKFLCLDAKFPNLMQVKKVIKSLEEVAQGEQIKLHEEMMKKQEEMMMKSGGTIVEEAKEEEEDDEDDIGEDEKKMRKALAAEGKKLGNNSDLIRETGLNSLMPHSSLTGGPAGGYSMSGMSGYDYAMMRGGGGMSGPPSKIQMLMGFNHLNTIEEEKHETQNSAYFRDGDESTHRNDQSNFIGKGSRILDELDQSHSSKVSPARADHPKYDFKELQNQNALLDEEEDNYNEDEEEEGVNDDKDVEEEEYEMDDDEDEIIEEDKQDKSIKDMKSVESDHDEEEDIADNYQSEVKPKSDNIINDQNNDDESLDDKLETQNNNKINNQTLNKPDEDVKEEEVEDNYEEESDYEI